MKIRVLTIHPVEGVVPEVFQGDWVDADTHDGELRITVSRGDGVELGYTQYAAGVWWSFRLEETATDDVLRARAALAEQGRASRPNGGRMF